MNKKAVVIGGIAAGTATILALALSRRGNANSPPPPPPEPIYGCTTPGATNYNPLADTDDGSCVFPPFAHILPECGILITSEPLWAASFLTEGGGITHITALNPAQLAYQLSLILTYGYITQAQYDCGMTQLSQLVTFGCTNPIATNYNPSATYDDGTCVLPVFGCTDPLADNYDPLAEVDNGSCYYLPKGCMDPLATNYDPEAQVDDGSCQYPPVVNGCMNPAASNYDPQATQQCGPPDCCTFPPAPPNPVETYIQILEIKVMPDWGNVSYIFFEYKNGVLNPIGALQQGSMEEVVMQEPGYDTLRDMLNIFTQAQIDSFIAQYEALHPTPPPQPVYGCTDPTATNYNSSATIDDGTCYYPPAPVYGCMNPAATNYNPTATIDDGSCIIPPPVTCAPTYSQNYIGSVMNPDYIVVTKVGTQFNTQFKLKNAAQFTQMWSPISTFSSNLAQLVAAGLMYLSQMNCAVAQAATL